MVFEGNCPQCGYHCIGWMLRNRTHLTCPKCGAELKITNGSQDLLNTPIPTNHANDEENSNNKNDSN